MILSDCSALLSFDLKSFTEAKGFGIGLAVVLLVVLVAVSRIVMSVKAKKSGDKGDIAEKVPVDSEISSENSANEEIEAEENQENEADKAEEEPQNLPLEDENATVAAIIASIALLQESEGKAPYGFRVVSFRRSNSKY